MKYIKPKISPLLKMEEMIVLQTENSNDPSSTDEQSILTESVGDSHSMQDEDDGNLYDEESKLKNCHDEDMETGKTSVDSFYEESLLELISEKVVEIMMKSGIAVKYRPAVNSMQEGIKYLSYAIRFTVNCNVLI